MEIQIPLRFWCGVEVMLFTKSTPPHAAPAQGNLAIWLAIWQSGNPACPDCDNCAGWGTWVTYMLPFLFFRTIPAVGKIVLQNKNGNICPIWQSGTAIWQSGPYVFRIATTVQGKGRCSFGRRGHALTPELYRTLVSIQLRRQIRWWHPLGCHHRRAAHSLPNLAISQSGNLARDMAWGGVGKETRPH